MTYFVSCININLSLQQTLGLLKTWDNFLAIDLVIYVSGTF